MRTGKCVLAGSLAGLANGMFGAGGGLILVPFFIRILHMKSDKALPTSIAVILPMSIISAITYDIRLEVQITLPFLFGGLLGGLCGGIIFPYIPTLKLRKILGIFIIYSGIRSILQIF